MFSNLDAAREETRKILPTALKALEKLHWRYRPVPTIVVSDDVMDCLYRPRVVDRILLEINRLCFREEPLSAEERATLTEALSSLDDPCGELPALVERVPLAEHRQERLRQCFHDHREALWRLCGQLRFVALGLYFRAGMRELNCLGAVCGDTALPVVYEQQRLVALAPYRIEEAMQRMTTCTDVRAALMAVLLHEHSHAVRDRDVFTPVDEHMAQMEAVEASTFLPGGRVAREQVQGFIWELAQKQPAEYGTFQGPARALGLKL